MKYVLGDITKNKNLLLKKIGTIVKTIWLSQKLICFLAIPFWMCGSVFFNCLKMFMGKIWFFSKKKNHQHHIYVNVLSDLQIK